MFRQILSRCAISRFCNPQSLPKTLQIPAHPFSRSIPSSEDTDSASKTKKGKKKKPPPPAERELTRPPNRAHRNLMAALAASAVELHEQLVDYLRSSGLTVLQSKAIPVETASLPLLVLLRAGALPERLLEIFTSSPDIYKGIVLAPENWASKIGFMLSDCKLSGEQALEVLLGHPAILKAHLLEMELVLQALSQARVDVEQIPKIVLGTPQLLTEIEPWSITRMAHDLGNFFTTDQIGRLLGENPRMLYETFDAVEERYEWAFFTMGATAADLSRSPRWATLPLEDLQLRHALLDRAGRWIKPKEKRPLASKDNPSVEAVFDLGEQALAERLAGVSLEELRVFTELWRRQAAEQAAATTVVRPRLRRLSVDGDDEEEIDEDSDEEDSDSDSESEEEEEEEEVGEDDGGIRMLTEEGMVEHHERKKFRKPSRRPLKAPLPPPHFVTIDWQDPPEPPRPNMFD